MTEKNKEEREGPVRDSDSKRIIPADEINFSIATDVDRYVSKLEAIKKGKSRNFRHLEAWDKCARFLVENGGRDTVKTIASLVCTGHDIKEGLRVPDVEGDIDLGWVSDVADDTQEKGNIKNQALAAAIKEKFVFSHIPEQGVFRRYDPVSGCHIDDAPDFIAGLVRKIHPDLSTTHTVNEVIAWIRETSRTSPDAFVSSPGFINLQNGVFDIKVKRLRAHSPDFHFTSVLPFSFNHRARRSRFFDILREVTSDDPRKAIVIMELFAWALIPDYPIQKAFVIYGEGNNGKSTVLDVLVAFLGRLNVSAMSLQTICENRFAVPHLRGKLANISGDVGNTTLYDTSMFKRLTGGDLVDGEVKGQQRRIEFINPAKLIFAFNQLPRSWDSSNAFYRRFRLLEFIQNFEGRADKNLVSKITSDEDLQDIFNVVVSVFLPALLNKLEFEFSESSEKTARTYELNSNPALAYINENLEADPESYVDAEDLYRDYTEWCKKGGHPIASDKSFGYTLQRLSGLEIRRQLKQEEGVRRHRYWGIRKGVSFETEESDPSLHNSQQRWITFEDALKDYVDRHRDVISDPSDPSFCTLRILNEYNIRVEKLGSDGSLSETNKLPESQEIIPREVIHLQPENRKDGSHDTDLPSNVLRFKAELEARGVTVEELLPGYEVGSFKYRLKGRKEDIGSEAMELLEINGLDLVFSGPSHTWWNLKLPVASLSRNPSSNGDPRIAIVSDICQRLKSGSAKKVWESWPLKGEAHVIPGLDEVPKLLEEASNAGVPIDLLAGGTKFEWRGQA